MEPGSGIRKPLRARKTMTPSSRKQVELLKNLHGLGRPGSSTYSVDNYVKVKMIETERVDYYSNKDTSADHQSKKTSAKEPVAKLVVNSEISIYDSRPNASRDRPYNNGILDNNVSLQDLLYTLYEKESNSPISKPVEVHLYPKRTSRPEEQASSLDSLTADAPASVRTEEKERRPAGSAIGVLKPADAPASVRTEEKERRPAKSAIAVLKPADAPSSVRTEEKERRPADSTIAILKRQLDSFRFRGGDDLPDDSERESRTSKCEGDVNCRRITSSAETAVPPNTQSEKSQSGLERVKSLMQSCIDNSLGDLDQKLERLNLRIDHIQCLQKHREGIDHITKKISQLNKRVNSVQDFQKAQLAKKVDLPSGQQKTKILNMARPLPDNPTDPSTSSKRRLAQPGEVPPKTIRSSAKETCIYAETSGVQGRNSAVPADAQQKRASPNAQTSAEVLSNARDSPEAPRDPKNKMLIDLTEEDNANPARARKEEILVKANPPPESTKSKTPQPATEPSAEIPGRFPHLPPLPDTPHTSGFRDTLLPQKLELAVAQVKDPKGIALHWNIREVDPRCAPIESFHLYICHESKKGVLSPWTKINEIKALPLPMACSISQLATSVKCYFAIQSKDILGRFGPFCDIQSICAS